MCAAEVNREFGLDDEIADTIVKAAKEVSDGPVSSAGVKFAYYHY